MSYELSDVATYGNWGNENFGGSTGITHFIVGPKGKVGFVRDIEIDITTAMVGTTTVPEIDIGISSGDSTYGRYRLGSTAILGYGIANYKASNEVITGNPPRNLQDYAHHVELDGYPTGTSGVPGGTFLTVAPLGRIPASGMPVVNDTTGTGGTICRLYMRDPLPPSLVTGQIVNVKGIAGETGANGYGRTISGLSTTLNYIELTGTTFSGTYTGGGFVDIVTVVTEKNGSGGVTAGAGYIRVKIQWIGAETP